jgi:hypothetical protein
MRKKVSNLMGSACAEKSEGGLKIFEVANQFRGVRLSSGESRQEEVLTEFDGTNWCSEHHYLHWGDDTINFCGGVGGRGIFKGVSSCNE